jgi:hypothetical protein
MCVCVIISCSIRNVQTFTMQTIWFLDMTWFLDVIMDRGADEALDGSNYLIIISCSKDIIYNYT